METTPPPPARMPSGSVVTDRMEAAAVRGMDAWQTVIRRCDRIMEEIDDLTPVQIPCVPVELHDEDSAVIAVGTALADQRAASR